MSDIGAQWSSFLHPDRRDSSAAFTATRGIVGAYPIDFRIMVGEEIRWISARRLGDDAVLREGQMFAGFLDVTGRKQAEEGYELFAGELSALGRADDLVRPIPGAQGHATLLGDLLSVLLSPYEDLGAFKGRIQVAVPRMW